MRLLQNPMRMTFVCLVALAAGTLFDGSLIQLWTLYRDHQKLEQNLRQQKQLSQEMEGKIRTANKPEFIEQQVRDQLDWVRDDDLVFVFSESNDLREVQ